MRYAALLVPVFAAWCAAAGPTEREVADWAIRMGGRMTVDGRERPIIDAAELPDAVRIIALDLTNTLIDPTDLRRMTGLTSLRELYLPGPSWNPASGSRLDANEELKNLAGLTTLERLYFSLHFLPNVNVRDNGLAYVSNLTKLRDLRLAQCRIAAPDFSPFEHLESLDVSYTTSNDAGMKSLRGLKGLRRLNLRDTLVTDEGMQSLADLTSIEEIDLYGTKVTDAGLAALRKLTALRKLNLLGADVSDESAAVLAGFPHLRELNLYRSRITNNGLAALASLKEPATQLALDAARFSDKQFTALGTLDGLKSLRVSHPRLGAAGIAALASMWNLRALNLNYTAIDDHALESLKSLTQLEELQLDNTAITDAGLDSLGGLHNLKLLNVYHSAVTQKAFDRFDSALPACKVIWDRDSALPNRRKGLAMKPLFGIAMLASALSAAAAPEAWITALGGTVARNGYNQVIAVNLENSWVTDSDLPLLAAHPFLTRLSLSMTRITDRGLIELKPLANLTDLDLYYAESITDQGLSVLKNLKRLRRLNLRGTKVTDSTLQVLNGLTSLESLDIGFAQVTDSGILRLTARTNLKELSAGGNKLTDAGLQALRLFPALTSLDLSGSQRTDSGLWSVSLTEPGLEIIATLKDLRQLLLNGMSIGSRGLEKLKSLSKLERLDLQSCSRIHDDAVAILQSLPALHLVDVSAAGLTEKGLSELRNSRPGLRIIASRFQPTNPAMPNGPAN